MLSFFGAMLSTYFLRESAEMIVIKDGWILHVDDAQEKEL